MDIYRTAKRRGKNPSLSLAFLQTTKTSGGTCLVAHVYFFFDCCVKFVLLLKPHCKTLDVSLFTL